MVASHGKDKVVLERLTALRSFNDNRIGVDLDDLASGSRP